MTTGAFADWRSRCGCAAARSPMQKKLARARPRHIGAAT
jgi:hypothetical protein